tara:strand:+ start:408 stop:782 length:375 start_codon:yes stop_codon:yes gene_type:complete
VVKQEQIIERFNKLRFRISFKARESHKLSDLETLNDMDWVKRKIEDLEGGVVLDGDHMRVANNLWKRYSTGEVLEQDLWRYIDKCLTEGNKIEAIKTYRQLHGCGLREAKDAVDARQMKNKGMI